MWNFFTCNCAKIRNATVICIAFRQIHFATFNRTYAFHIIYRWLIIEQLCLASDDLMNLWKYMSYIVV